ncbi:BMP family ABC transporter substrate-binding protein [Candidatus Bathyarchaeota archaeon]|nr:BMP family ABC transporter substrate-binding protein [Candidatus Bathyarchaeota archaeon]MBS7617853.1 BMP family ABC transporter substrate-binding protein [Candidatus Bathyarchaeota archaeon]
MKYLGVGLIIGLLIGVALGFSLRPAGVSIEEYERLRDDYDRVVAQLESVTAELQMLRKPLKVGFIYVGPVGDWGWSHAHDTARRYVENIFPWVETVYVEAVPEGDCPKVIDRLIDEGCDVVFTTSFGFMDATIEAGEKYPDKIFFHCSGYMRRVNVGTYFAEFYQLYYLNGLMAGALTKTNKVGYVAAHPIPEVVRHINAFALGVKEANPNAVVDVRWIFSWYDPSAAREAAESLIAWGADVLAFTEDSPTVVQVSQEYYDKGKPVYCFGHYSPMQDFGPDVCVSGQLVHWEVLYADILSKIRSGYYNSTNLANVDYWWMLREGAVELGGAYGVPINPKFIPVLNNTYIDHPEFGRISAYDLIMKRLSQMSEDTVVFDPFTGPIYDNKGNLRVEAGRRMTHDELWTIDWFVDNIVASIPV